MNGYSKIKEEANTMPRISISFADMFSLETPKSETCPKYHEGTQQEKQIQEASGIGNKDSESNQDSIGELQKRHEVGKLGDNFGVKLSRNSSVSAASTSFQASLKRAFSMKRSSSVSESYSRIHDQGSSIDDEDELGGGGGLDALERTKSMRKKKKQNNKKKFVHACKKILGL